MKVIFTVIVYILLEIAYGFQGTFWHVCDLHLNLTYKSFGSAYYGDYQNDPPFTLIKSTFQQMKNVFSNPDFIILNGDNVYHEDITEKDFILSLNNVSGELLKKFPNSIILPSFGNHDINPANLFHSNSTWCDVLYNCWKRFFNNFSAIETESFRKGCYYSHDISIRNSTVKIIVLNTILWYSVNSAVGSFDGDPLNQFLWLDGELVKSRQNSVKVFIVGHVPPGASEYNPQKYKHLHPNFNKRLLSIFQDYADVIEAGFFSHQHTDAFKIVYNNFNKPLVPIFLSPSVSPYHLPGLGSINPSVRLYYWNDTITNRRYEQYHTKLNSSLHWTLEYNSTSLLPGLSASHLNDLVSDFNREDSLYFDTFFRYHLSGQAHDNNDECSLNSSCRCNIICGIQNIDYSKLDTCLKKCPQKQLSQWAMIMSVIVIFTIILIGVVVGANKVYCRGRRTASLTRDIYLAPINGKNREEIMSEHIDNIAENTFGDVPEYRGHIRNNSRTILTLNDGNEIIVDKPSKPYHNHQQQSPLPLSSSSSLAKFALKTKSKGQEKYDYTRM